MTRRLYGKGREAFCNGAINWPSDTIKAVLIDVAAYTVAIDTHQYLSDIPGGAIIGSAVALASKTNVLGVLDAEDFSFTGLSAAPSIEALVYYKDTGTAATSPLLIYDDGAQTVTIAAAASSGATSLAVDALAGGIANGAVLTKVSGSGPSTITLSASASAVARSVACSALGAGVAANDTYSVAIAGYGLPVAAGAVQVDVVLDNGANKLIKP